MPADVEIMIVSYASAAVIERCLTSVARCAPETRVAIREHSSDPEDFIRLEQIAAAAAVPVRFDVDPSNPGFGAGCNALAASSTADWFLFLNPDAELVTWLWNDREPPRRTIIGPEFTADTADHYGRTFRVRDEIARSWLRRRGRPPDGRGFVSGAALLIDAGSFREIGGFDESYFLFYEDIELCLRANRHGVATIVEPAWRVRHERGHSTRPMLARSLEWSYESACRFHDQQGSPVRPYRAYVAADSVLRAVIHRIRRNRGAWSAYLSLAQRALGDCVRDG